MKVRAVQNVVLGTEVLTAEQEYVVGDLPEVGILVDAGLLQLPAADGTYPPAAVRKPCGCGGG